MPHGGGPGGQAGNPSGGPAGSDASGVGGIGGTPDNTGGKNSGGPAGVAAEAAAAAAATAEGSISSTIKAKFDKLASTPPKDLNASDIASISVLGGLLFGGAKIGGDIAASIGLAGPTGNDPEAPGGTTGGEGNDGALGGGFLADLIFPTEPSAETPPLAGPPPDLPGIFPSLPPQVGEGFQLPPITPAPTQGLPSESFATTLAGVLQRLGIAA